MNLEMFRGVVPFVAVAREKSFRQAAVRLGVSAAAVSKSVQQLEARVGAPLFVRSARAVSLTREGELFFERCQQAVAAVDGGAEAIEPSRSQPAGELVVSAPFVASSLLPPALAILRRRYPALHYRLVVTDRLSKLAEESVDVAVRIGPIAAQSLVARRLRGTRLMTVAAPSYLAVNGAPKRLADLDAHACLSLVATNGKTHPWLFSSGPRVVRAEVLVDHGPSLIELAVAGLGVTQLFDFMAEPLLRSGALQRLFEDETATGPDVHAVCAPGRKAAPRIRAAFAALVEALATRPSR